MCKISGKNEYEDNKLESENILLDFVKEKLKSSI
jgi:hypothetical protein